MKKMLLLFLLAAASAPACSSDATMQLDLSGNSAKAIIREQNRRTQAYASEVEMIVAHKIRVIRVAEERAAMAQAGHPVALLTGGCSAVLSIKPDGTLLRAELAGCRPDGFGPVEMKAIRHAAPFPPPGIMVDLTISNHAFIGTPGVNGN